MATLTVQPAAKDTYLEEENPTTNNGADDFVFLRNMDASRNRRPILEFDISALPSNITITSATLSLRVYVSFRTVGETVRAYKLTRTDWVESEATWNIYKTGSNWTTAGGDYVTSNPAGGSGIAGVAGNWMDLNVLSVVQDAYDNSIDAEFLVRFETESEDSSGRRLSLRSSEYSIGAYRPKLVIIYTIDPPTVTIQAITNIVTTTARGHGAVTDLGSGSVTEHGLVWSTLPTPDTSDSKTELGAKATIGTFVSELTLLTEGLTYYVRAYAVNAGGTSYSSESSFVAGTAGAQSFPTQAITRVTNLIHRYNRKEGDYSLELALGEVTSDFGLPEWLSRPRASIPGTDKQRGIKEAADSPEITKKIFSTVDEAVTAKFRETDLGGISPIELPGLEPILGATARVTAPQPPTPTFVPPRTPTPLPTNRQPTFREWQNAGSPGSGYARWVAAWWRRRLGERNR
ncbi:hypothetical protein LCGC14_0383630 [marine sediment metagenome]|uniref:Fibronectin type-III domain-containing protein n=1 Tax=marine sediment metagenome TaxID=412755 RepID=A0A0F9T7P1_9ZZZZ